MDYNKTVLKRWSRTILSICSTLLNVPLKLKGRSRIRLGFGFFFCVFTIIFQCRCPPAPPQNRWPSCAFFRTLFSAGRCFLLFPWPFSRTGNLLVLRQLRQTFGAFCFSLFFLRRFCPVAKSGIRKHGKSAGFSKGKSGLFFCFYFIDPLSNIT